MADDEPNTRLVSRQDAISLGLKFYFTDRVCWRGHRALRRTGPATCTLCEPINLAERRKEKGDAVRARDKVWRDANSERRGEQERARYAADPERFRAKARKSYAKNGERARDYSRNYHHSKYSKCEEMRLVAQARTRQWMKDNPERAKANRRNGKSKRRNIPGSHTAEDIARIFKQQRGKCAHCRKKLPKNYQVDHIQPVAKGGTNDARNIQLSCAKCNREKWARDPISYAQMIGLLL